jgi:hypothetical protein
LGTHLIDDPESGKVEAGRLALALELFYGQALQRAGVALLQNLVRGGRVTCKESGFTIFLTLLRPKACLPTNRALLTGLFTLWLKWFLSGKITTSNQEIWYREINYQRIQPAPHHHR